MDILEHPKKVGFIPAAQERPDSECKAGECYRLKVVAITMNQWTGRPQVIIQQQSASSAGGL